MYLVFNGAERYFIEQIRVNNKMDLLGTAITQAELIALILILIGVFGVIRTWKKRPDSGPVQGAGQTGGAATAGA